MAKYIRYILLINTINMFFTSKRELDLLDIIASLKDKVIQENVKYKELQADMLGEKRENIQTISLLEKKQKHELTQLSAKATMELATENQKLKTDLAVAQANVAHLEKIVNINADIYDIKNIINKVVEKLPTINLTSLSASTSKE